MAAIFLDLDGTLTDPRPGITRAFAHALTQLGYKAPPADELSWVIGPALIDSFAAVGVTEPEAALAAYRTCYTGGAMYECTVYPGIPEVLAQLRAAGHDLLLATAKPHVYAKRITAHFGLSRFLSREYGPELDGTRNDKGDLLAHAVRDMGEIPARCIMIGDRVHDIRAARAVGFAAVAVTWGYGTDKEHAQADALCQRPADLPGVISALL